MSRNKMAANKKIPEIFEISGGGGGGSFFMA